MRIALACMKISLHKFRNRCDYKFDPPEQLSSSPPNSVLYMYVHWSHMHTHITPEEKICLRVNIGPSWATIIFFITPKFCTVEKQLPNLETCMQVYVNWACMHAHITSEMQKSLGVYIGPSWATFIFFITPKFCTVEKQLPNIETCMQGFVHCACMHANITPEMQKSLVVYVWPSWGTLIFFITPKFCNV